MTRLEGKVALVTGAARGQGRSHAIGLAREGADVAICDICTTYRTTPYSGATPEELRETEKLVTDLGRRCVAVEADVRDRGQMRDFVARTIDQLGGVDIVVANAGVITYSPAPEFTDDQWDEVIDTNLTGVWNTVRACLPHLVEARRGGSIVLISSTAGLVAVPGGVSYTAAKHGVVGIMKALAVELGSYDIRVNAIHPSGVKTPMVMNEATYDMFSGGEGGSPEHTDALGKTMNLLPIGFLDPNDITNAILYLVSDEGRWVTGTSLKVDAGFTENPPGQWRNVPDAPPA